MDVAWKQRRQFICIFIGLRRKKSTPELRLLGLGCVYKEFPIIRFSWPVHEREACRLMGTRLGCPYLTKRLKTGLCFVLSDAWDH